MAGAASVAAVALCNNLLRLMYTLLSSGCLTQLGISPANVTTR
jgi:hypothetical protein